MLLKTRMNLVIGRINLTGGITVSLSCYPLDCFWFALLLLFEVVFFFFFFFAILFQPWFHSGFTYCCCLRSFLLIV